MSEKFCLQWNSFQENVATTFQGLRDDSDFHDVTLVSEDFKFIEAHRVILSASSPFFYQHFQTDENPSPNDLYEGHQEQ